MYGLILQLSKNDFKKRYAGSVLGALWAFLQPVVTVVMYYLVFEVAGRGALRAGNDVPYVLYLTAGLVPWFYFSEALPQGTQAFLEYAYLVKKVVFPIEYLPVVKVLGASVIHGFFVLVLIIIAVLFGYSPSIYTLQVLYYSFALFMLVLGLSYATSAIVIFFRDLAQIIAILLQIGMWATPILWDLNILSDQWRFLFSLNPLTYIVNGYRGAIYGGECFFQNPSMTVYFWTFTTLVFLFGLWVFRRLRPHFADVL